MANFLPKLVRKLFFYRTNWISIFFEIPIWSNCPVHIWTGSKHYLFSIRHFRCEQQICIDTKEHFESPLIRKAIHNRAKPFEPIFSTGPPVMDGETRQFDEKWWPFPSASWRFVFLLETPCGLWFSENFKGFGSEDKCIEWPLLTMFLSHSGSVGPCDVIFTLITRVL